MDEPINQRRLFLVAPPLALAFAWLVTTADATRDVVRTVFTGEEPEEF